MDRWTCRNPASEGSHSSSLKATAAPVRQTQAEAGIARSETDRQTDRQQVRKLEVVRIAPTFTSEWTDKGQEVRAQGDRG